LKTIPNTPRRLPEKWEAAQFLFASTGAYFSIKNNALFVIFILNKLFEQSVCFLENFYDTFTSKLFLFN